MTIVPQIHVERPGLFGECPITAAVHALASAGIEERGAVFTRREVVDFILDLTGYTVDRTLSAMRLLEPSFGGGDFLIPAIDRLLASWRKAGGCEPRHTLARAICAVELHRESFIDTRNKVVAHLENNGLSAVDARALADQWLVFGDFLLVDLQDGFDVVVGNPPYVRQEMIADALMAEYRARYRTIYDRADLYVPFIERSLESLNRGGHLGFICADRWMKNRYGGPLRDMVSKRFHLKAYVDMVDTPAFLSEVSAYPAITIIANETAQETRIAYRPKIDADVLSVLARSLTSGDSPTEDSGVKELSGVTAGSEPWILESLGQLALVRRLEKSFPKLEDAGCKVGIGVATGADQAFIGPFDSIDVENDRKLPLVMTRDIQDGHVKWRGFGVINPFANDGKLVDLEAYPRLRAYLEAHRPQIERRHIAQRSRANWYRTIDRIYPAIANKPKLLIPDIKGEAHIVYENEGLYPHHNLYFITSDEWDLRALHAVLRSGIARMFVSTYSTKMRGGYLRFQAQYLRRIRIPKWAKVPALIRQRLIDAAELGDQTACNRAVFELYGLNASEQDSLEGTDFNGN